MPRDLYEQTASLDELVLELRAVSPGVQLDVKQPKYFRWRARFLSTPHLQVWRARSNAEWQCAAEHNAERFYVALPTIGALQSTIHQTTYTSTGAHALVLTDPEALFVSGHGEPENAQVNVKWHPSSFQEVLQRVYGHETSPIRPLPTLDLRSTEGQLFHFMARGLAAGHFQDIKGSAAASALISETMLRLIIEGSRLGAEAIFSREPAAASSLQVRAAIDIMYERLHEPLTLGSLAASLGISGRSLQQAFRRYHDTTPLTYLRGLRLQAVHRELSDPQNVLSVSDIAAKWGFAHPGRLAKLYQSRYGRPPSETIHLAQRRR